ncbi:uncharacterized protein V1518DRAFT_414333 [Limtongia smithiae]|uniref:uncharacterized protein n=1 Tax=Limtongia smithiae TaxID=1125753 RepID=UPI0034CD4DDC
MSSIDNARKRVASVMDLRAVLNDVDEDPYAAKKFHPSSEAGTYSTGAAPAPEYLIDRKKIIKDLRRQLRHTNARISKIDKELGTLTEAHGEVMLYNESVGDRMRVLLTDRAALETSTKQAEKRMDRAEADEARLRAALEKLTIKHDAATRTLREQEQGRHDKIRAEAAALAERSAELAAQSAELQAQVAQKVIAAEDMRVAYQRESTRAAEICREVMQANEDAAKVEPKATRDGMRLRLEQRHFQFAAQDDALDLLKHQVPNLEDAIRRITADQQQRLAKLAPRSTTYSARRTRSPAPSTLSRGHSPVPGQNNNASGPTSGGSSGTSNGSSNGHSLHQAQAV